LAKKNIPDEEIAYRIVRLYFEEIARLGFKRTLDLDAIINAYFYSLQRLKNKDKDIDAMKKIVFEEEKKLSTQSKEDIIPVLDESESPSEHSN
jgi:hypothetical protein